jgi:hypothetical protein
MRDRVDDPRMPSRAEIEERMQEDQAFRLDTLMTDLSELEAEEMPPAPERPMGFWVVVTIDNRQCPYQATYIDDMNDPDNPSTWLEMPSAAPFGQWMARRKWEGDAHLVRGDVRWLAYCGLTTPLTNPASDTGRTHGRCSKCVSELMRLSEELRAMRF